LRSWDDLHEVCGRFGVVLRLHGNGLVFEDAERQVRVKASCVGREFGKSRLCKPLGDFRPAFVCQFEASGRAAHRYSPTPPQSLWKDYARSVDEARLERQHAWSSYRDSASRERQRLKETYRLSGRDRKRLSQQLALHQAIQARVLRRKLANQRKVIQKQRGLLAALPETPHPGTWRHFVASRAAHGATRAIRLRREQERS